MGIQTLVANREKCRGNPTELGEQFRLDVFARRNRQHSVRSLFNCKEVTDFRQIQSEEF